MKTAITSHHPKSPTGSFGLHWLRFVLPLLALSLLIATIGTIGYRYLSKEIRRENDRTLAVIVEQKRQQIESWLTEARIDTNLAFYGHSQLEILLSQWQNGGRKNEASLKQMQELMTQMAQARNWAGLAVVDIEGRPAFAVGEADTRAYKDLIRDILRRPRIELVDLHNTAKGEVQYGILTPIGSPDMAPLGVAYVTWNADQTLNPLVESWPVPTQTAETYLVRRDGEEIRFLTPLRFKPDAAFSTTLPLSTPNMPAARAARGERGIIEGGSDYRGIPVLAFASVVAGTPWVMIAEIDEIEAYAGIRNIAWATTLAVGFGLLLLYSAGYLLWRKGQQRQELTSLKAQWAAEARFRVIFEQAPLGFALADSINGKIMEANARLSEIVGQPLDQLMGVNNPQHRFTHPDDIQQSLEHTRQLNAGEISSYSLNKRYLHPDGSVVWASVTCAPVQVDADTPPRHLYIVEDITARKQMKERLQISEERHRLLADNAIDIINTMDLEGRFSYVSPSVKKLRGYTAEEVMPQSLKEVLTPDSLIIAQAYFGKLRANVTAGLPLENFRGELEQQCKDGSSVWTDVTASPILSADGNFVEILGVSRDISERKRYEHELKQAYDAAEAGNAAKSEFLAHMSHEIRTPMNAVLGLAQVLEREPLIGKQREMVERIRTAGQALLAILDDVLDLSKIEAGQLRIEPRPFDLGKLLANLDSLMGQIARTKGLTLRLEPPATQLGPLLGDGLRLEQILFNLTGNAIKFTESGEVAVFVQVREIGETDVRLRFEVCDSGIGIEPEALARLFSPFTQADAGISRRFGGTGLGLSICKRLVELMGGEIGVKSQVGQGSIFWFDLPFQKGRKGDKDTLANHQTPTSCEPRLVGTHILVVDDSAMNRDLMERALAQEGANTTLAADGQQAVQFLKTRPEAFNAVLMDIQMPVMDGLTAIQLIRGELGLADLPIIAFTAGVSKEQQAAARTAGANDVLAKPMDLEQMAVMLSKWTKPSQVSTQVAQTSTGINTIKDFPDIAGIDKDRAAKRLSGDRDMFISLLEMFFDDNINTAKLTQDDLTSGDRDMAARRMHTLVSNAGFICALDIMESAKELEQAIDQGDGETALNVRLETLDRQITELVEASKPWRPTTENSHPK